MAPDRLAASATPSGKPLRRLGRVALRAAGSRMARHALLATALLGSPLATSGGQVDLVLSGPGELYTRLADSLETRLSANPVKVDLNVIRMQAGDRRIRSAADLRVGVGMKACESLSGIGSSKPVLCSLVPRAGFVRLAGRTSGRQISAIYLDQPIARQFALARALLPDAQRVGLLAGPALQREAGEIRRSARAAGFQADLEPADDEREAVLGIQRLVSSNDLILAAYDSQVLTPSTAKWLLHLAYQKNLPVLGFSRTYLDAGAAAAVYSTPEQIGRQTAEAILQSLQGDKGRLAPSAFPRYFDVAVNRAVARTLGLDPPPDAELARRMERPDRRVP